MGPKHWPKWEQIVWRIAIAFAILWIPYSYYSNVSNADYLKPENYVREVVYHGPGEFVHPNDPNLHRHLANLRSKNEQIYGRNIEINGQNETTYWKGLGMTFGWPLALFAFVGTLFAISDRFKAPKETE
jgi:hypothetical protein